MTGKNGLTLKKLWKDTTQQISNINRVVKKGVPYVARDITFKGDDLHAEDGQYKQSGGNTMDPRVHLLKKQIRYALPLAFKYLSKVQGLPKFTHPIPLIFQGLKREQVQRRRTAGDQMKGALKAFEDAGVKDATDSNWDVNHVIEWIEMGYDAASVIAEADPYYRAVLADALIQVFEKGEAMRCNMDTTCRECTLPVEVGVDDKGKPVMEPRVNGQSNWIGMLYKELNGESLRILEGYVRGKKGGKDIRLPGYDEGFKIKVEKEEVEA